MLCANCNEDAVVTLPCGLMVCERCYDWYGCPGTCDGDGPECTFEGTGANPRLLDALKPFANLASVMNPKDVLVYRGVYITYEQAKAAKNAIEGVLKDEK